MSFTSQFIAGSPIAGGPRRNPLFWSMVDKPRITSKFMPNRGVLRHALHRLNIRPWAVLLVLTLVSVPFLPVFEVEANRHAGTYYRDRIFRALAERLRTSSSVPALIALGFATGFVHYLLDRSVYRMSNAQVRVAAAGLLKKYPQKCLTIGKQRRVLFDFVGLNLAKE